MLLFHKARKNHKCDLCEKIIPKGDVYWRDYKKDDEGFVVRDHKEHTNCELYDKGRGQ